ncbi:hypothetical protein [Acidithiobacillus thiooxidans]|nr:hypothetical protein [Acidithiobacillus thiooxidans]
MAVHYIDENGLDLQYVNIARLQVVYHLAWESWHEIIPLEDLAGVA